MNKLAIVALILVVLALAGCSSSPSVSGIYKTNTYNLLMKLTPDGRAVYMGFLVKDYEKGLSSLAAFSVPAPGESTDRDVRIGTALVSIGNYVVDGKTITVTWENNKFAPVDTFQITKDGLTRDVLEQQQVWTKVTRAKE